MKKITLKQITSWERVFLGAVCLILFLIVVFVSRQAYALINMANTFDQSQLAYDSAVVQTFVEPFNRIIAAFVVYAFGKLGLKVTDNYIRLKHANENTEVELNRISVIG
jgi:hypothetical protein